VGIDQEALNCFGSTPFTGCAILWRISSSVQPSWTMTLSSPGTMAMAMSISSFTSPEPPPGVPAGGVPLGIGDGGLHPP
jgi:hypothetical protein